MIAQAVASLAAVSLLALPQLALAADEVHGAGLAGTVMGPVAFLWPADRPWSAEHDNIAPCGSSAAITNRTNFPLGSIGAVSFSIADEAYDVAIRIAYGNSPNSQDDFQAIQGKVSEIEPGHQCYPVPSAPSSVLAGSNATIQLEYWANDSNKNESFFACADITFVEVAEFDITPPCFNVTSSEFNLGDSSDTKSTASTGTSSSDTASTDAEKPATETPTKSSGSNGGLSAGAKAGIAVGVIAAAALLVAAGFFIARQKRRSAKDPEVGGAIPEMAKDNASFTSGDTRVQRK